MVTVKSRLFDIIIGFVIGMISAMVIILWDNSSIIQRIIAVAIWGLTVIASVLATRSKKYSNNGNDSPDNSTGIISVDSKNYSRDSTANG